MIKHENKISYLAAAMLLAGAMITTPTLALTGTVNDDGVRFCEEANIGSAVLDTLSKGDRVEITGKSTDWYEVTFNGASGYIASDYIFVGEEDDALSAPSRAFTGVVNSDDVFFREDADTDSEILRVLSSGDRLEIIKEQDSWCRVRYKGKTGYVTSNSVTVKGDDIYLQVADGPLNIRVDVDVDSEKAGSLSNGTVIKALDLVEDESGAWYRIEDGFIFAEYVVPCDDPDREGAAAYVEVKDGPLNIRSGPSIESDILGSVSAGKVVEVNGLTDGWYKVGEGYIFADYVKQSSANEVEVQRTKKAASDGRSQRSPKLRQDGQDQQAAAAREINLAYEPVAQGSGTGQDIANYALRFVGYPYSYGGSSPSGFDCSGLTSYVYKQFGYNISRTASGQLDNGYSVSSAELQPGDLVMFKKGSSSKRASHVGIYIGGGQFVHASTPKNGVIVSDLGSSYYSSGFVGARRLAG